MASLNEIKTTILEPMTALYVSPKSSQNEQEALRAYAGALKDFSAEDLERGWEYVVRNHKIRSWPLPSEIINAVAETSRRTPRKYVPKDDWRDRVEWEERAKESPGYQVAMKEGLALPFLWVAGEGKRVPGIEDLPHCRKRWDNMLSYRERYRGKDNGVGDQIVRRNERLCRGEAV